ncbi:MAG: AAA family ATPase [Rhodospirillales bacterium]|nr:AAA family ATPase [Rhodospirillales bacterium]
MRDDTEVHAFIDAAETYSPDEPQSDDQPLMSIDLPSWYGRPVPERRWMVRDWMPWGYVTALYGDGGTGKSLLAQQLMTACVIGQNWLGLETAVCSAIGLFCEDDETELLRRQDCINSEIGVDFRDLGNLHIIPRVGDDNVLMTFDRDGRGKLTPLWHALVAEAKRREARLAVIDTAADTFGGDEIRRSEVRQFIASCLGRFAREIDGAVLVLAHPSLSGMASGSGSGGSTAWSNTVRSRLYLNRPEAEEGEKPDNNDRILTTKKANYAATGCEIRLRWQRGVFVPEGVGAGSFVESLDERNREREVEGIFLSCLRDVRSRGQHASDSTASRDRYAPKLFRTLKAGRSCSAKELMSAMSRLFDAGKIRIESVLNANRNYVAAIVEVASS